MASAKTLWCCLGVLAITVCVLWAGPLSAERTQLDLKRDFDWRLGQVRSETTVLREMPCCVGFSNGEDVEFKSEGEPFTIVPVTLQARKGGVLDSIVPEFFLVRNDTVYRTCLGVRFLEPKPGARVAGFHPPFNANVWPGHGGDRLGVQEGDEIAIELLFGHIYLNKPAEVLVVTSAGRLQEQPIPETRDEPLEKIR